MLSTIVVQSSWLDGTPMTQSCVCADLPNIPVIWKSLVAVGGGGGGGTDEVDDGTGEVDEVQVGVGA